jgi:hypothetical protein
MLYSNQIKSVSPSDIKKKKELNDVEDPNFNLKEKSERR